MVNAVAIQSTGIVGIQMQDFLLIHLQNASGYSRMLWNHSKGAYS
jgi:hypothetical protein